MTGRERERIDKERLTRENARRAAQNLPPLKNAEELADGVVRPVMFMAYSGEARWRDSAGEEHAARLGEPLTAEQTARAWKTALNPAGEWMPAVIAAADTRLRGLREHVPDAGGMIIASDQTAARAYAELLRMITGEAPTVVLSDDPGSSQRISDFSAATSKWLVAVRMVSEGVDVPRLSVGVYATSASTPLFFAQAIGRFVRSRRAGETASIFLPSVPNLLQLASELEEQRNHVLGKPHRVSEEDPLDEELREQRRDGKTAGAVHHRAVDLQARALVSHPRRFAAGLAPATGGPARDQFRGLPARPAGRSLCRPQGHAVAPRS